MGAILEVNRAAMSDSGCLANLLPVSSPCNAPSLLHFNEKADLGHDLLGLVNIYLLETSLQDTASADLESSKAESGSSLKHRRQLPRR